MEPLIVLVWFILSLAAGIYAIRLDRSFLWGVVALALSPLVVFILLFALGPKEEDDDERVRCPYCAEDIRQEAIRCPHCQSELGRAVDREADARVDRVRRI